MSAPLPRNDPRSVTRHFGSPALNHLAAVSNAYQEWADGYADVADAAAQAEAEHKSARARFMLAARATGLAKSQAEAEMHAEADPEVSARYLKRLTTKAKAEAHLEKLRQLRSQNDNGRSYTATERELDRMHAQGLPGSA